jgi:hypothetical protein
LVLIDLEIHPLIIRERRWGFFLTNLGGLFITTL